MTGHFKSISRTEKQYNSAIPTCNHGVSKLYLGDNCIQKFHLGRYIIGYTVGNLVLLQHVSRKTKFPKGISDDIPPQLKCLNMVIPTLMHFCSIIPN